MQAQELQYRFKQRIASTHLRIQELMVTANREVYICDPDNLNYKGMITIVFWCALYLGPCNHLLGDIPL